MQWRLYPCWQQVESVVAANLRLLWLWAPKAYGAALYG